MDPDPYLWLMDPDLDLGGPNPSDPDPQHRLPRQIRYIGQEK